MAPAMWKAVADLVALLIIWAGTMAITLGGVPALIGNPVRFDGQDVTFGGPETTFGHTSSSQVALRRYWAWAVPGFIAITIGVLWQVLGPLSVLLPNLHLLAVFRQG